MYSCLETLWEGESDGEMDGALERTRDFVGELGLSAYISLLRLLSRRFSVLCPSFDLAEGGDNKLWSRSPLIVALLCARDCVQRAYSNSESKGQVRTHGWSASINVWGGLYGSAV